MSKIKTLSIINLPAAINIGLFFFLVNVNSVFAQVNIEPGGTHEFNDTTYTSFPPTSAAVSYSGDGSTYFTREGLVWLSSIPIGNGYLCSAKFTYKCAENTPSGTYNGRFTIVYSNGSQTKTVEPSVVFVVSGGAAEPVAGFTAAPTSGEAPLTVQFTDKSTGDITSRLWDFGDGQTSSSIDPSHIYQNIGRYTVKLTVSGPGGSDAAARPNYIRVKSIPEVNNVRFEQRTDGTLWVDIYYDVTDADGDTMDVFLQASANHGQTWDLPCTALSGDIGNGILSGKDKHIIWDFYADNPNVSGDAYRVRVTAEDDGYLDVEPDHLNIESAGNSQADFEIFSNMIWRVTDNSDWLTVSPSNGFGNDTITCTAASANPSTNPRTAEVIVSGGAGIKSVSVTQNGAEPVLEVSPDSLNVGWVAGSNAGFTVNSNTSWTVNAEAAWLSVSPAGGSDSGSVTVTTMAANTSSAPRNTAVTVSAAGIDSKTVTVTQLGLETSTMTDIDGNVYPTVKIGSQWWMAKNLKVTKYRNGSSIPNVTDNSEWAGLSTGAYCFYDNADSNITAHGLLYNWYAVDDSRNIAPDGWHVPSDDEWKELEMYLGMSRSDADNEGWRGTDEGSKLKAASGWYNNGNGTNESGLKALPGGYRDYSDGTVSGLGYSGLWWSSTENSAALAWRRALSYLRSDVYRKGTNKQYGISLRCVKD